MSFPRLVLSGDPAARTITAIQLEYDNVIPSGELTTLLIRDKYETRRETRNRSASTGTRLINSNMQYDEFRMVHTWMGHVDVLTESVIFHDSSPEYAILNNRLINLAVVLRQAGNIVYQGMETPPGELGPYPNLNTDFKVEAKESCPSWVMSTNSDGTESYTSEWFIKNINIVDNGNKTSRVTFVFEAFEQWLSLSSFFSADT